jgi:hypothetical protein
MKLSKITDWALYLLWAINAHATLLVGLVFLCASNIALGAFFVLYSGFLVALATFIRFKGWELIPGDVK